MAMNRNQPNLANNPYAPQMGVQPNNDPVGNSVIMRGLEGFWNGRRDQIHEDNARGDVLGAAVHMGGPLPDPQWQGFYQAMQEHAPGGIAPSHGRGDPMPGLGNSPFNAPSTMWQSGQSSAVTGNPYQSQQPANQPQQALKALKGVR